MPQGWVSDMCDPVGRLAIINGASYLYPLDTMAAYIGPSPNHQNGRISSVKTRFNAGIFCAARGVSLNVTDIDQDLEEIQTHMAFAKATQADMLGGQFSRVIRNENEICWQYTTADKQTVYLAYFHLLSAPNLPFRRARMVGLEPSLEYILEGDGSRHCGDSLMRNGMPMPYVTTAQTSDTARYMDKGDFSSHLFIFKRAD